MKTFYDWIQNQESSASTRNKWNAALGLQPMYSADVFGRATPPAWQVKSLTKKLKRKKRRTKKRKKN